MAFLDAFVITLDPVTVKGNRIFLGEIAEGFFIVEKFPEEIRFHVYVQIGFEPEDWGQHTLRVELCVLGGSAIALLVPDRPLVVPEPSEDWPTPLIKPVAFPFVGSASFETGFDIVVYVDGEEIGSKGIIVVRKSDIPDDLSELDEGSSP